MFEYRSSCFHNGASEGLWWREQESGLLILTEERFSAVILSVTSNDSDISWVLTLWWFKTCNQISLSS